MLEICREKNLTLNPSKTQIGLNQVKYLGHIFSDKGLKVDPEKVQAVVEMPRPKDKQGVQRCLGMATYLAKFIPRYSDISAPMRQLIEKHTAWCWEQEQENSFNEVKRLVSTAPVLQSSIAHETPKIYIS